MRSYTSSDSAGERGSLWNLLLKLPVDETTGVGRIELHVNPTASSSIQRHIK